MTSIDVLHLLPSLNLYGGTPRKIRDLIKGSCRSQGIYCWASWEGVDERAFFEAAFKKDLIPIFDGDCGRNFIAHALKIVKIIDDNNVKVIHGYFESGFIIAAVVGMLRKRVCTVISFVGFPASIGYLRRFIFNILSPQIDHLVYVSQYTQRSFEQSYPILKLRNSNIIYNGVKPRHIDLAHICRGQQYTAITVSGLNNYKNVGLLLEVVSLLRSESSAQIQLLIVGDGPLRMQLEEQARILDIADHVKFCGYREDVGALLSSSDVYLHPAVVEGFGIAVVEAMLVGLPVVVSDAGALPEIVDNGISGLIVSAQDTMAWVSAIKKLLNDPSFAKKLGESGRSHAANFFSIGRFVDDHELLYNRLILSKVVR